MADHTQPYEAPSAEDYFSDNTQGRGQSQYVRETGASTGIVKARKRPKPPKRCGSFSKGLLQFARRINQREFDAQLDRLNIPRPDDNLDMPPILRDGIFPFIGELLRQLGQGEWALRPRTFCILRILGCPDLMDAFVASKRTDAFLPYSDRNLPAAIRGDIRRKFLRVQELVLSGQKLEDLEKEGGAHFSFHTPADEYFSQIKLLGQGGYGVVDHVWGPFTLKHLARKRILRGGSVLKDQKALTMFLNELETLKKASHRHLVKLVSSYTDPTYVGIIMRPVADEDLKAYLKRNVTTDVGLNARKQCIRTFFGCLSKALEYLHEKGIQHRDIKPQNVLVKKEHVYLTDFGTAKAHGELSRSTSTGRVEWTPKYGAPEIAQQDAHGRPSDIWSLGCVFLEMITVLRDRTIDDLEAFYVAHGGTTHYYRNQKATSEWILELGRESKAVDTEPLTWVQGMMQLQPAQRPTISQVIADIADAPVEHRYFCHRCFDDEHPEELYKEDGIHSLTAEMVTETTLQTQLRQDHVNEGVNYDSEDTVTAQFLEDIGAVTIAKDQDSPSDSDSEGGSPKSNDTPSDRAAPAEPEQDLEEAGKPDNIHSAPEASTPQSMPLRTEQSSAPRPALKSQDSATADSRRVEKQVTFVEDDDAKVGSESTSKFQGGGRFCGLRADRRPEPSKFQPEAVAMDEQPVISPEPLRPPCLDMNSYYPLPKATLVPSYVLAGSNRFDMKEVRASEPALGSFNLFVYGRLMFPSALRGFAARSLEGVYSPQHQRRLVPSSSDWSRADTSIKRAAEIMTPARLNNYDAWRPSGFDLAAIQFQYRTKEILATRQSKDLEPLQPAPAGEVAGFLILGLTEEALRYCDLIFCSDNRTLQRGYATGSDNEGASGSEKLASRTQKPMFERRRVTVDIQLSNGQLRSVSAATYACKPDVQLWHPWRPETFVRGCGLQNISKVETHDWRGEETSLATVMKVNYALVGDELCAAILKNDIAELHNLLDNFDDVDARCRNYGTPLQAAISKGSHEMTQLLLDYGADPSKSGGKYGTPLIAATMGSRKSITRILLKHRADVFGTDKKHVSALYQAVGHGDYAITEMLLEAGAWLSQDYGEVKDLACERRDPDLKQLLQDYDIRDAQLNRLESSKSRDRLTGGKSRQDVGFLQISSHVAKFVLRKFIVLSSEPGSWRGRKGVALTRAALAAGAPLVILEHIRNAMDPITKLIDLIKAADKRHDQAAESRSFETGRVEELTSDDEGQEDVKDKDSVRLEIPGNSPRTRSPSGSPSPKSPQIAVDRIKGISTNTSRPRADSVHSRSPSPKYAEERSSDMPSRRVREHIKQAPERPHVATPPLHRGDPSPSARAGGNESRTGSEPMRHTKNPSPVAINPHFLVGPLRYLPRAPLNMYAGTSKPPSASGALTR
ncbi:hypothetical protein FB567DRAFT_246343 [Paraphoma chrysanthemicola]|uniref:non-specific serine/threonine protein kinase n=1 Tax=Paraphoma chrysanthemicola TaxID=798071 RepID=A0A8K0VS03_9PLEO|nr:hypothetical protein FB567DRAFT_246343 [Paraphoma chrysanthemicola]